MSDTDPATFGELVTRYAKDPDVANLARLRSAVVSAETFDPGLNLLAAVGPLMEQRRHQDVIDTLLPLMPGAALNPMAHRMLAAAYEGVGDETSARREQAMHHLSVSSVLMTGDGTAERPWSVLRVADEYDILRAKGVAPTAQSTGTIEGRLLDRHEDESGAEYWFVLDRPSATPA